MSEKVTIAIDRNHNKILEKLCKANQATKKDFVCASILYFEKYGINPLSYESPAKEMQRLIKRVDQVVAFMKKQETEILKPAVAAISISEERIQTKLEQLPSKQDIKNISERFQFITSDLKQAQSLVNQTRQSQEQGFKLIAKLIDAKEKTGVFSDIAKAYNQNEP